MRHPNKGLRPDPPMKTVDGSGSARGDTADAAVAPSSKRRRPTFGPCEHGVKPRSRCVKCVGCEHGRQRHTCKECGGTSVCGHGKLRHRCKECGGASVCAHGRLRYRCKECMGEAAAKW